MVDTVEDISDENCDWGLDDDVDDLVCKVSDIILEYCGGRGDDNFQSTARTVELAAEDFVCRLLNDLTAGPSVCVYRRCGNSGASGSGPNPDGRPGDSGHSGGRSGSSGENGGPPADRAPGDSQNGERSGGDENPSGFGKGRLDNAATSGRLSCPFRKRNPSRFNPVDFHACATTPWKDLSLLK